MDRLIYVAMTGAKHTLYQQAVTAHNLANASTVGYKAEASAFRALPVFGEGANTRTFVVDSTTGADMSPGPIQQTGRDLDVAVQGQGWIAVQASDGTEAYTRNGSLLIGQNGLLQTRTGQNVLGDGGPLAVPPDSQNITIGKDGTISVIPQGQLPTTVAIVGRIKLVNPPEGDMVKGSDGLFRLKNGTTALADAGVAIASQSLETSNVNAVDSLVSMINLSRSFDMQLKLITTANEDEQRATQILSVSA